MCAEWERLLAVFLSAIGDLIVMQAAGAEGMLELAERRRASAKLALLRHLETHPTCGC